MTEFIELTTTTATEDEALKLGRMLIDMRLAACVQISGPIHSIYRWQGEVCQAAEFQCSVKSLASHSARLTQTIRQAHSYDTPQIIVVPVAECDPSYAQWWRDQIAPLP
jgi:periplasmic divalent cation tolerance protein